ncbi:hypothetical protein PTI45_03564 [Paenibacillus nuruki]|uniref:Uncharacterized protein n=1 Tax=Paenibacillus nuruki TaxID=1886670 RepID=A0A1E3L265_9BACL|nr:hypothetical protein PTI45_03564 [Paenibacillus nuruki]
MTTPLYGNVAISVSVPFSVTRTDNSPCAFGNVNTICAVPLLPATAVPKTLSSASYTFTTSPTATPVILTVP